MIKFNWLAFDVLALLVIGLNPPSSQAAEPVLIFDGKTLDGWDYDPDVWRVEDGLMTGGSTTEKIKANYENGVMTITLPKSKEAKVKGREIEIS
jgi:hypothetical protein